MVPRSSHQPSSGADRDFSILISAGSQCLQESLPHTKLCLPFLTLEATPVYNKCIILYLGDFCDLSCLDCSKAVVIFETETLPLKEMLIEHLYRPKSAIIQKNKESL